MTDKKNLRTGVLLTTKDVDYINKQIEKGEYLNRSDFIREAVREKIKREDTN